MTKPELLLDVIGEAQDKYLEELDAHISEVKSRKKWTKGILIAACLCFVVGTALFGWLRLAFGSGSCNYAPEGIAAGGYFYYEVQNDGIYRYTPNEGSVKLVGNSGWSMTPWYSFTANDCGFYYTKDNWIYRIRHGESESEKLYQYEGDVSTPQMYPAGAADIAVYATYETRNTGFHNELFNIDGVTGERRTTIIDDNIRQEELDALPDVMSSEYDEASDKLFSRPPVFAEKVTYTVGGRTLELVLEEGSAVFDYAYRLTENGKRLTESYVEPYDVRALGDSLAFVIGRDGNNIGYGAADYLIVHPDGTQQLVKGSSFGGCTLGNAEYCFSEEQWGSTAVTGEEQTVSAVRISDNETFKLKWNAPQDWFIFIYSDGKYLWMTFQTRIYCYEIEYQDGVPTALNLIDRDVIQNHSK